MRNAVDARCRTPHSKNQRIRLVFTFNYGKGKGVTGYSTVPAPRPPLADLRNCTNVVKTKYGPCL